MMVLGIVLTAFISFTFVAIASYAGTLRALEVYHDPSRESVFLSQATRRRRIRNDDS